MSLIYYRFLSNMELGRGEQAEDDVDTVLLFYPNSFDVNLAVIRMHLLQGRNGSALLLIDKVKSLAETDEQKALAYYWSAMVYEAREGTRIRPQSTGIYCWICPKRQ